MPKVRIRRLDPSVELPAYGTDGSAAFDLAASADTTIAPGEVRLVPTGLVIEVPEGMFLAVFARSSTPLKRGLMVANGVGVVDSDYCGPTDEVKIPALNFTAAAGADRQRRPHRAGHPAARTARRVGGSRRVAGRIARRLRRNGVIAELGDSSTRGQSRLSVPEPQRSR